MKLTVKTLKGSHFEITVQSSDSLLIHNGKVLKDETTLAENKVSEDGFLVVMLGKSKTLGTVAVSSTQPCPTNPPTTALFSNSTPAPEVPEQPPVSKSTSFASDTATSSGTYGQAASNLVAEGNLEQTIQQIMDIGGGNWDRETVARALRAAYNHPERAVDYLYSGIPEAAEVAVSVAPFPASRETGIGAATAPVSGLPNASLLNMFPQETVATADGGGGGLGSLEFLRNNPQFQALYSMVQSNPQILQPMLLQEMGKQNPQLLRLIEEHQMEFLPMINEPPEGSEGDAFDQLEQDMPHGTNVTPAEQEAIDRRQWVFDRALVIEAFLACDHNEELAAKYLLENAGAWRF